MQKFWYYTANTYYDITIKFFKKRNGAQTWRTWLPFQIFQESYSKNEIVDGQFIMDNTLGKDVKFTIDVLGDETVKNLTIYNSNNIVLFNLTNEKISNYYVKEFPILQVRIFTIFVL